MQTTGFRKLVFSLAVPAAALLGACGDDSPVGPDRLPPSVNASVAPAMSACPKLAAPAESKLVFHVYANGVQIYRWNGSGWSFVGPEATLSADASGNSVVGIHYAGPKWESNSGGKVTGTVIDRCTPNPDAIPWLSLSGVSEGGGIFHRVTFIQRVNTVGGKEPTYQGSAGEVARVPYTTEYFFYRTK